MCHQEQWLQRLSQTHRESLPGGVRCCIRSLHSACKNFIDTGSHKKKETQESSQIPDMSLGQQANKKLLRKHIPSYRIRHHYEVFLCMESSYSFKSTFRFAMACTNLIKTEVGLMLLFLEEQVICVGWAGTPSLTTHHWVSLTQRVSSSWGIKNKGK